MHSSVGEVQLLSNLMPLLGHVRKVEILWNRRAFSRPLLTPILHLASFRQVADEAVHAAGTHGDVPKGDFAVQIGAMESVHYRPEALQNDLDILPADSRQ